MIRFQDASFSYRRGESVISHLNLEISPGLNLVLGENGCGKSTLLKLAAGIEAPQGGSVEIGGHDLWRDEVAARRDLAYVAEQPDLTPYATIREVLELVCRLRGVPTSEVVNAMDRAAFPTALANRSVRELSMGQRRKAVLAAARIGSPHYALLDEPLETMDRAARADILEWIGRLLDSGATVVVVSHDIEPFVAKTTRAFCLRAGRLTAHEALPEDLEARFLLLDRLARGLGESREEESF